MRLFLAIEIPDKIKDKIDKQLKNLKKLYPQFNWVPKENYHITLYFFGERKDVDNIKETIKSLIWDQEKFYLYSFDLDVFVKNNLIIYLNFYREKKIENLAYIIKKRFVNNDFFDKKFIPHLTIARSSRSSKQQYFALQRYLKQNKIEINFLVDKIVLYQSILTNQKPIYKKLTTFNLLKKDSL